MRLQKAWHPYLSCHANLEFVGVSVFLFDILSMVILHVIAISWDSLISGYCFNLSLSPTLLSPSLHPSSLPLHFSLPLLLSPSLPPSWLFDCHRLTWVGGYEIETSNWHSAWKLEYGRHPNLASYIVWKWQLHHWSQYHCKLNLIWKNIYDIFADIPQAYEDNCKCIPNIIFDLNHLLCTTGLLPAMKHYLWKYIGVTWSLDLK